MIEVMILYRLHFANEATRMAGSYPHPERFIYFLPICYCRRRNDIGGKMGDFTQKSVVKSAVRNLTVPIADYTTFNTLVQNILDNNPWGCTAYESAGVSKPAVEKTKEAFAATIV
ncbi:MAG: hypothetical protein V1862_12900 [Methanobacteriota archaeon]